RGLMTEPKSSAENETPPEEGGSVPPPVELPDAALQRVTEELAALKDKYLRSAAEFENFRKRTAKERVEVWAKAQGELIERLVDGLDDLNRFAEIDQTGVPFDPKVHEAVTMGAATAAEQDHTVGAVLQAGYRMGETLIRPARVMVLSWKGEPS